MSVERYAITGRKNQWRYTIYSELRFSVGTIEFGEIPKICKQTQKEGKLGRPKIQYIIFLYHNTEMHSLRP